MYLHPYATPRLQKLGNFNRSYARYAMWFCCHEKAIEEFIIWLDFRIYVATLPKREILGTNKTFCKRSNGKTADTRLELLIWSEQYMRSTSFCEISVSFLSTPQISILRNVAESEVAKFT